MHDLTGFQCDVFYLIAELENPKGLSIKDELDDYYRNEINHGRLYPNLDTLVEKELVDKSKKDDRTNEYHTKTAITIDEADVRTRGWYVGWTLANSLTPDQLPEIF